MLVVEVARLMTAVKPVWADLVAVGEVAIIIVIMVVLAQQVLAVVAATMKH